jgi:hypothetical protein
MPPAVQLVSIAAQKGSQREEIGGASVGTDVRELELPASSGSEKSSYVVTYKETDLFGDSTLSATRRSEQQPKITEKTKRACRISLRGLRLGGG